jgi:hypothetical protein
MTWSTRELVDKYLVAAAREPERLAEVLRPDVTFGGTVSGEITGVDGVVAAFRRLGPIIERYDIKDMVVDGDRAFVLYDFVTNTAVGPVLSAEHITVRDGLIGSIVLLFDLRRWPEVMQELAARTAVAVSS